MRAAGWRDFRLAEFVPISDPVVAGVEVRHDEMVPLQNTVQRPTGGDQPVTVRCRDQLLDQRIDDGVLDADTVAAALLISGGTAPEITLFVAG